METQLHLAVLEDNFEAVSDLIKRGANVNSKDYCGITPLELAAESQNLKISKLLLDSDTHLNLIFKYKITSLLNTAVKSRNVDLLKLLFDAGADVNAIDSENKTPLLTSIRSRNLDCIKLLVHAGADVNQKNISKDTPLHYAVKWGNSNIVKLLLDAGANPNEIDGELNTPLHCSVTLNNVSIAKVLLNFGAQTNCKGRENYTSLHLAVKSGNLDMVKLLLDFDANADAKNSIGYTPLHLATKLRNLKLVKFLTNTGMNLNAMNNDGLTALHMAVEKKIDIVKILVDAGVDVNSRAIRGRTPMHVAIAAGKTDIVELLVNTGGNIDAKDNCNGTTPLHVAVAMKNEAIFEMLLKAGADTKVRDDDGNTLLHWAAAMDNANIVKQLINAGVDINAENHLSDTPLHRVSNNLDVLRVLLDSGAETGKFNSDGHTPLTVFIKKHHSLQRNGNKNVVEKMAKLMIENTDVNLKQSSENVLVEIFYIICKPEYQKTNLLTRYLYKIFVEHIAKLKVLDSHVDSTIFNYIQKTDEIYFSKCLDELERAKSIKVRNSWLTFFDLIVNNKYKFVKYAGNDDLIEDLKNRYDEFPVYGATMLDNLTEGQSGRKLFEEAANVLSEGWPIFNPTHLIIWNTLDTLSLEDWKKLCE